MRHLYKLTLSFSLFLFGALYSSSAYSQCVDTVKYVDSNSTGDPAVNYDIVGGYDVGNRIETVYEAYHDLNKTGGKIIGIQVDAKSMTGLPITVDVYINSINFMTGFLAGQLGATNTITIGTTLKTYEVIFATPITPSSYVSPMMGGGVAVGIGGSGMALTDSIQVGTSLDGEGNANTFSPSTYYKIGGYNSNWSSAGHTGAVHSHIRPIIEFIIPEPIFTTDKDNICTGDSIYFDNQNALNLHGFQTSPNYNHDNTHYFNWNFGDGSQIDSVNTDVWHVFNSTSSSVTLSSTYEGYTKNCQVDKVYNIGAYNLVVADFTLPENTSLVTDFTDNSTGATTWLWNFGDGKMDNSQNPTHTFTSNGSFDITLTASNPGCYDIITKTIGFTVGIEEGELNKAFTTYPNPAYDALNISTNNRLEGSTTVEIFNVVGVKVMELKENFTSKATIDVSSLSTGKYIIKIENNKNVFTKSFVKQ